MQKQSAASGSSPKLSAVRNSPKISGKPKEHQQTQQQAYATVAAGNRGSPRKGVVERRDSTSAGKYLTENIKHDTWGNIINSLCNSQYS